MKHDPFYDAPDDITGYKAVYPAGLQFSTTEDRALRSLLHKAKVPAQIGGYIIGRFHSGAANPPTSEKRQLASAKASARSSDWEKDAGATRAEGSAVLFNDGLAREEKKQLFDMLGEKSGVLQDEYLARTLLNVAKARKYRTGAPVEKLGAPVENLGPRKERLGGV